MGDILKKLLRQVLDDLDSGSSAMSEEDELHVIRALRRYTRRDVRMSKSQACAYVGLGRSAFDALVREGGLPKGRKQEGFKELSWTRRDLDRYIKDNNIKTKEKCQTT